MRKKFGLLTMLLLFGTVAYAAGSLYDEFRVRENIRLTQDQGNAVNFLRLMNYNVDRIEELEVSDGGNTFFARDRDEIICAGIVSSRMVRCKNKIGLTTVVINQAGVGPTGSRSASSGPLALEFRRREGLRLTQEQGNAVEFLRLMKFNVSRVDALEMIDGGQNFVIRDRDNVVCLGDIPTRILRCKNRIGLTTVTFDGDAD